MTDGAKLSSGRSSLKIYDFFNSSGFTNEDPDSYFVANFALQFCRTKIKTLLQRQRYISKFLETKKDCSIEVKWWWTVDPVMSRSKVVP